VIEAVGGGGGANYLVAKAMLHQSDIKIQEKKIEEAEKVVLEAQGMIAQIYSENHPCIMDFNSNLVEIYASMPEESQRRKTVQIAEKNLEIAK